MKQITTLTSALLFAGGMVFAQTTTTPSTPTTSERHHSSSTHSGHHNRMSAEIVSTDASAKTITVRNLSGGHHKKDHSGDTGTTSTAPATAGEVTLQVQGKAADRLASLSPGDRVTLTCQATASSSLGTSPTEGSDMTRSNPPSPTTSKETAAARTGSHDCSVVTDIAKAGTTPSKKY